MRRLLCLCLALVGCDAQGGRDAGPRDAWVDPDLARPREGGGYCCTVWLSYSCGQHRLGGYAATPDECLAARGAFDTDVREYTRTTDPYGCPLYVYTRTSGCYCLCRRDDVGTNDDAYMGPRDAALDATVMEGDAAVDGAVSDDATPDAAVIDDASLDQQDAPFDAANG